ncbi:period circadian protein-like isoform X2 [Choristoneura fumiferana]|uniref:period circadian protein-like isoform X2 n=1 Tax=Choristoneura fumiferana TaxID=7141 RepID=UPI003D15D9BA
MDNLDDSENNAKISDSAYSNSCSNSQSRRSHSSKSTHSGSNSSGSSGYGGKQSTSGSSNNLRQLPVKRTKEKDGKKNEHTDIQTEVEFRLPQPAQPPENKKEEQDDAPAAAMHTQVEKGVQDMETQDTKPNEDAVICHTSQCPMQVVASRNSPTDGFSCVISMQDGIVMYTTSALTNTIGFPKDMWIGRSFIDFIHPLDHSTFASQITKGPAISKKDAPTDPVQPNESTMFCRIRKYRGLATSFGVKDRAVTFMPFTLKLTFKNGDEDSGMLIYLIIQATPLSSAFKSAHEIIVKAVSFVIRHVSSGNLEHIDPEAVPFLGYFPQDVSGIDVLRLYHPDDLTYLRQIYETIMKEGSAPRSKPYRLMAQNGDYLKLETEWSSFVNPWSHKLEFVVAKHHVLEGPGNPDVFEPPVVSSARERRSTGEERSKTQCLRDHIVRTMNKVLTKPAEFAKQQMSKRCKDLASFMESLIQEPSKAEPPDRVVETLEKANSCEHDSVILGGISPHHDYYSDSKASSETPLSYNQLNFNDNLQRFFDNHQELTYEEYQQAIAGHMEELKDNKNFVGGCLSPMALYSTDSADVTSSGESSSGPYAFKKQRDTSSVRLTESLLSKHNTDMEKSLVKKHRISRLASKEDREKASYATKQKKKEHLARCNASFVPTSANSTVSETQPHGLKRPSKRPEEQSSSRKHHCSPASNFPGASAANSPAYRTSSSIQNATPYPALPTTIMSHVPHVNHTAAGLASYRPSSSTDMMSFVPNVAYGPHAPMMDPLAARQGLIPFLYVPTTTHAMPSTSSASAGHQYHAPPVQYLMYGPAVVGSPIMVSPISAPPFSVHEGMIQYGAPRVNTTTRITTCNNEEPTKTVLRAPQSSPYFKQKVTQKKNESGNDTGNSDEAVDPTDGESSYSSFYSSFFKTESGSADDSSDSKNTKNKSDDPSSSRSKDNVRAKAVRRKMEPPWMEQVCVTPELIYKYQKPTGDLDQVLAADRKKMASLEQPSLVNEQLAQLYTDLQLEGVAARLTLEEGLTSSSSSGSDSNSNRETPAKRMKKKRQYTKLVMIFEEDAPMPSPQPDDSKPSTSPS